MAAAAGHAADSQLSDETRNLILRLKASDNKNVDMNFLFTVFFNPFKSYIEQELSSDPIDHFLDVDWFFAGSYADNTDMDDSDLDIIVVLNGMSKPKTLIKQTMGEETNWYLRDGPVCLILDENCKEKLARAFNAARVKAFVDKELGLFNYFNVTDEPNMDWKPARDGKPAEPPDKMYSFTLQETPEHDGHPSYNVTFDVLPALREHAGPAFHMLPRGGRSLNEHAKDIADTLAKEENFGAIFPAIVRALKLLFYHERSRRMLPSSALLMVVREVALSDAEGWHRSSSGDIIRRVCKVLMDKIQGKIPIPPPNDETRNLLGGYSPEQLDQVYKRASDLCRCSDEQILNILRKESGMTAVDLDGRAIRPREELRINDALRRSSTAPVDSPDMLTPEQSYQLHKIFSASNAGASEEARKFWCVDNRFAMEAPIKKLAERLAARTGLCTATELATSLRRGVAAAETISVDDFVAFLGNAATLEAVAERVVGEAQAQARASFLERLRGVLAPADFGEDIVQLQRKFLEGTRDWVFAAFEGWLALPSDDPHHRVLWIQGTGGLGKSVIAAQLVQRFKPTITAHFFCKHDIEKRRSPRELLASLTFQLAAQVPAYAEQLEERWQVVCERNDGEESLKQMFERLLVTPMSGVKSERLPSSIVLLVDALDELEPGQERQHLLWLVGQLLPNLPEQVRLLVLSRPENDIKASLADLCPLKIEQNSANHRSDVRKFIHDKILLHLAGMDEQEKMDAASLLDDATDGVFLAAELLRRQLVELWGGEVTMVDLKELLTAGGWQKTVHQVYRSTLDRIKTRIEGVAQNDPAVLRSYLARLKGLLAALLAAYDPLTPAMLVRLAGETAGTTDVLLSSVSLLFAPTGDRGTIQPLHKTIVDYLRHPKSGEWQVDETHGHAILARGCWMEVFAEADSGGAGGHCVTIPPAPGLTDYALKYGHRHLTICLAASMEVRTPGAATNGDHSKAAVDAWVGGLLAKGPGETVVGSTEAGRWLWAQTLETPRLRAFVGELRTLQQTAAELGDASGWTTLGPQYAAAFQRLLLVASRGLSGSWFPVILSLRPDDSSRDGGSARHDQSEDHIASHQAGASALLTSCLGAAELGPTSPAMLEIQQLARAASLSGTATPVLELRFCQLGPLGVWHDSHCILSLPSRKTCVCTIAFSTDGALLATGGRDGRSRVWEASTGNMVYTSDDHNATAARSVVAWSALGSSGGGDARSITDGDNDDEKDQQQQQQQQLVMACSTWEIRVDPERLPAVDLTLLRVLDVCGQTVTTRKKRDVVFERRTNSQQETAPAPSVETAERAKESAGGAAAAAAASGEGAWPARRIAREQLLCSVAWSGESKRSIIAAGSQGGTLRLVTPDGGFAGELSGVHAGQVQALAWAGRGSSWLASGSTGGEIWVWRRKHGHSRGAVAATEGAAVDASAFERVWEMEVKSGDADGSRPANVAVYALAWSRGDGEEKEDSPEDSPGLLAAGCGDGKARVWSLRAAGGAAGHVEEVAPMQVWNAHGVRVSALAWAPDGKRLVTGGHDHLVKIWRLAADGQQLLRTLTGHSDKVEAVCWSPDGSRVASGGWDGQGKVWDAMSKCRPEAGDGGGRGDADADDDDDDDDDDINEWPDRPPLVHCLAYSGPENRRLVRTRSDGEVAVFEAGDGPGCEESTIAVVWAGDGSEEQPVPGYGHKGDVLVAAWEPTADGCLATGGADKAVCVWKQADDGSGRWSQALRVGDRHEGRVQTLAWGPECVVGGKRLRRLAVGGGRHPKAKEVMPSIWIYNVDDGSVLQELHAQCAVTKALVWRAADGGTGEFLAAAGSHNEVRIWVSNAAAGPGSALVLRPDGAGGVGGQGGGARPDDSKCAGSGRSAPAHEGIRTRSSAGWTMALAASPGGRYLATGSSDTSVKVWRTATGHCELTEAHAHDNWVRAVAWSGDRLATGDYNQLVLLWQVKLPHLEARGTAAGTTARLTDGLSLTRLATICPNAIPTALVFVWPRGPEDAMTAGTEACEVLCVAAGPRIVGWELGAPLAP